MKAPIISLTIVALILMGFINKTFASENSTLYKATETNALGKPTMITVSKETDKNILIPEKQYRFDYNKEGLMASKEILKWDIDKSKWNVTEEYKYEYNKENQLVSQTYIKWDQTGKQNNILAQQMLYIYGADGELLTINYMDERTNKSIQTESQNFTYK